MALFYRCPWCRKPRRHLYLLTLVGAKLVDYLGLRCQVCAGLRFASQGRYITGFERAFFAPLLEGYRSVVPFPRRPWDPRAVSDPRLVAEELFQLEDQRNGHRVGADAVAWNAAGGVGGAEEGREREFTGSRSMSRTCAFRASALCHGEGAAR